MNEIQRPQSKKSLPRHFDIFCSVGLLAKQNRKIKKAWEQIKTKEGETADPP